ncbi:MAG: hypothetical protein QMC67_15755 [Candidatus Wallbacteria bacterium]
MIMEYNKFEYICTKYKNDIIHNTMTNKYLNNLFDYYARYLNFYPHINEDTLNYDEKEIKVAKKLEKSFNIYINARDQLTELDKTDNSIISYFPEAVCHNMFNAEAEEFYVFIINDRFKLLKNTYINYNKLYKQITQKDTDKILEPIFIQDGKKIKIVDIWEL